MGFLNSGIIGELLVEAWDSYRKCVWKLALLAFVCNLPYLLWSISSYGKTPSLLQMLAALAILIPTFLLHIEQLGASLKLLDATRKEQLEAAWLKQCLFFGWSKFINMLGAYLLLFIAIMIPLVIAGVLLGIIGALAAMLKLPPFSVLVLILILMVPFICLIFWAAIRLMFTLLVCFFEGWTPIRAIVRSFVLTSGNFWILLTALLAPMIPLIVISILVNRFGGFSGFCFSTLLGVFAGPYITAVVYRAYIRLSGEDYSM